MIELAARRVLEPEEARELWRDARPPELAPSPILARPTLITDELGVPLILVDRLPTDTLARARHALRSYPVGWNVVRTAGIRNRARPFGYLARSGLLQRAACTACLNAREAPHAHETICDLALLLADMLEDSVPSAVATTRRLMDPVLDEWRLPGGLWTSGVVNDTSVIPYHLDGNNFEGAWSAMPVVRRGVRGGHLHFPEWELSPGAPLVLPCSDGDVVYFAGSLAMHGVTPIRKVDRDGYRFSAVYYPVENMARCLPWAEEVARAKSRGTANADGLLDRQRAAGHMAP